MEHNIDIQIVKRESDVQSRQINEINESCYSISKNQSDDYIEDFAHLPRPSFDSKMFISEERSAAEGTHDTGFRQNLNQHSDNELNGSHVS